MEALAGFALADGFCRVSKQPSHTRTSFSIPYLGKVDVFEEHWPQNTCPQLRQWCLRSVKEKAVLQRSHTSPSAQSGAVSEVNIASASSSLGKVLPSVFRMFIVSWGAEVAIVVKNQMGNTMRQRTST